MSNMISVTELGKGIQYVAGIMGVTEAKWLAQAGEGEATIWVYDVGGERVIITNGDPVWESENADDFAAVLEEYGIQL